MMLSLLLAVAVLAPPPSPPSPAAAPVAPSPSPTAFESYQLVLLQRPEHPRDYPEAQLEEIQKAHLAHLRALAEAGKLLVAGPFDDQPDPRLRGLELLRVGSVAEAKRLADEDPAVKAGRLEAVVMTWYTEKGALAFPGVEKLRKP